MTEIDNNTIKNLEEKSNVFVNWVDNETPINAKNLNVINDIVAQVGADVGALSLKTNELNSQLEQKAEKSELTNQFNFKGNCAFSELPTIGNVKNDTFYVTDKKFNYTWNGTEWFKSGSVSEIGLNSIEEDKTVFFDIAKSENIIDVIDIWSLEGITDGEYMRYTDGQIRTDVTFYRTKPLQAEELKTYNCVNKNGTNFSAQVCYLGESENFISGVSLSSGTEGQPTPKILTPLGCKYIVFSMNVGQKNNSVTTNISTIKNYYKLKEEYYKANEIILNSSHNLKEKLNSLGASEKNKWIVYLEEGIYNTLSYFTEEEKSQNNFYGFFVPNFVTLKAKGKKENTILTATFEEKNINVSTVNLQSTSELEGLTIIGNKTRYAVHDDFTDGVNKPYYRKVKNCTILGYDTYYSVAYGSGVWNGAKVEIEDCYIEALPGLAYGWHTRTGFTIPTDTTFKNCTFVGTSNYQVKLGSKGSGVKNKVHFIGCNLQGIQMREEVTDSGVGLDFEVDGYGNSSNLAYYIIVTDAGNYYPKFNDEIIRMRANTNMSKGSIVYKDGNSSYCVLLEAGSIYRFFGVVMNDVEKGQFCDVKIKGVIPIETLGIANINNGDRVGLINGVPSVVTTNDYFAICKYNTHATITM